MVDVKAILSNPWVWGIGGALGLILLVGRGTSSPSQAVTYNGSVANYTGMELAARNAEIAASVQTLGIEARTNERMKLIDAFASMFQTQAEVAKQQNETAAGVIQSRIASDTALRLDKQQNNARYAELVTTSNAALTLSQGQSDADIKRAKLSADLSRFVIGAQLQESAAQTAATVNLGKRQLKTSERIAKITSKSAEKISKTQTDAAFWGGIWNGVFGLASLGVPKLLPGVGV